MELELVVNSLLNLILNRYFIEMFLKVLIFPGLMFVLLYVMAVIWFERKFLAKIHLRIGPLHVGPGPLGGLFQPIADFIKVLQKEIIVPEKANKVLYNLAPILAVAISFMGIAFIPFGPFPSVLPVKNLVIYYTPYSLLLVLVFFAVRPFVAVGAGWASGSKYTTIGALRVAYQLLAYEVPLILSIACVVMVTGSFDLIKIVESQSQAWFILLLPIGFLVFLASLMAELGRRPFDLPHAEQEIVYGWITEYTGIQFTLFMLSEYIDLCIGAVLTTALFLGGWLGPAFLPPVAWFIIKVGIVTVIIIMGRGTWPRFRMDQLLNTGWKILIPLALIQILLIFVLARFTPWILPVTV